MPHRLRPLLLLVFVAQVAHAGVLLPQEPGAHPLTVRKQHLDIVVSDQVARATLDEVFENRTDKPLAATYTLPLPDGAAISGFATWVDGLKVSSRVEEKADAERTFTHAAQDGKQPALLEQSDAHTFRTRVDGIPAQGTKRVEASFAQVLPYDSGTVTLRVPLAVQGEGGSEPIADFEVNLDVRDSKPITDLALVSAKGEVKRVGPSRFTVHLAGHDVNPQAELVLTYRTESSRLGLSFVTYRPSETEDGYFLLLASPQELTTSADIVQKDVLFVFDTSGSMGSAQKIEQARDALQRCLSFLNPEDQFGILAFSDSVNPFRNKLVTASAANVHEAIAFAQGLSADGGTNIQAALHEAMRMLSESTRPRVLVFMTDGIPGPGETNPDRLAEQVKRENSFGARVFSFGVGDDVNRVLLEKLGRENRGAVDYVASGQNIETVIGGFYAKIAKPVLSDLAFDFGDVTTRLQYPDVLPDLYKGSQLVMVGRYHGEGEVHAAMVGTLNGKKVRLPFTAKFPKRAEEDAFVARLWAQKRIDFLLAQTRLQGERQEARDEVIALSKEYQIVTPYTSLVAVKTDPLVASVFPQRVKPGDPTVFVRAPEDAQVQVTLPSFHDVKRTHWDAARGLWVTRFLVPPGTPDGSYPVAVTIHYADGRTEHLDQRVAIDTRAPAFEAKGGAAVAGKLVHLEARAVVSPLELADALLRRDDANEAMKALFDVRRVSARLWDGREVELHLVPGALGFSAEVETPRDLAPGRYPVAFTAQDFAGNVARTEATVEVLP